MPKIDLFLDSSALILGIISSEDAARVLLLLAEDGKIKFSVSQQVLVETERNLARKAPNTLPFAREMIRAANIYILRDPSLLEVEEHMGWISHAADVPILVAAARANVDFLVTLNRHHFIDDRDVAVRSGLRIGTPGDALAWVREKLQ